MYNYINKFSNYQRIILDTYYPKAAVLLPLFKKNQIWHILFTQRASHLHIHAGEVAFPGGRFEPQDGSLIQTVLRETSEEIGINKHNIHLLGCFSDILSTSQIQVTPFIGIITNRSSICPNKQELENIFTVPINFFINTPCTIIQNYQTPSFKYKKHHIWGLTALIVLEFINIFFDIQIPSFPRKNSDN